MVLSRCRGLFVEVGRLLPNGLLGHYDPLAVGRAAASASLARALPVIAAHLRKPWIAQNLPSDLLGCLWRGCDAMHPIGLLVVHF